MKICTKCNEKFESGKFCKYCGGALVEENAGTQEAHCTNCGALLKDGAKFCPPVWYENWQRKSQHS